ncbi:hypothetical protein RHSIM_Rhsim13G0132300 [Rhododendron simsii]|uniref:Uncharacterized protein n=1 Tax=Rhododendron simsii TaxID=118357 RepID=A0A834G0Y3_RHOSS|nr:hypothetical protein RHSIM_Rhsim13G0132300 [Rhododendron simsii]
MPPLSLTTDAPQAIGFLAWSRCRLAYDLEVWVEMLRFKNDLYLDNLEAWQEQLVNHFTLEPSKNEKALSLRRMLYAWPPSGMHKSTAMCSWDNCRETMDA